MANKIARVCWFPLCGHINCTIHGPRPKYTFVRKPDVRPSASRRGYDADWRKKRAAYLAEHPYCVDCGKQATDVDHEPSRRRLVAQGVTDPDAEQYLHSRCHSCHSSRTVREDGGWGRGG